MHLIDHGRNYVEKKYKRPFSERIFRDFLSKVLPKPNIFKFLVLLSKFGKIFKFLMPGSLKTMMDLSPKKYMEKL